MRVSQGYGEKIKNIIPDRDKERQIAGSAQQRTRRIKLVLEKEVNITGEAI